MTNPFENDDEEWVEVRDADGRKAALRHLATIRCGERTYLVLGAVKESDDGGSEGGFLLVRRDETLDGEQEYIVTNDESEIENVVGSIVMNAILSQIGDEPQERGVCGCGLPHEPGDFCYCDQNKYLQ